MYIRMLLISVIVAASIMLGGCAAAQPKPPAPAGFSARDVFHFKRLPELVATSDLVIVGEVTEVKMGRCLDCSEGGDYPTRELEVEVGQIETLKGEVSADSLVVVTLEAAYTAYTGELWRTPGTQVAIALRERSDRVGTYMPTNHDQSVYKVSGDALSPMVEDQLSSEIGALTLQDLRLHVGDALKMEERGEVKRMEIPQR